MKLNLCFLGGLLFIITLITGCQTNTLELQENDFIEEEIGAYAFGPVVENISLDELFQFEYNGDEVRIHYYVQGWSRGIISEFGWLLFVDGVIQPTRLETLEGEPFRDAAYMHEFGLNFEEKIEFYVVFTPVSGTIGQEVGVIGATILRPNFMPESIDRPYFQIFHSLSATLPAELSINSNIGNHFSVYRDINFIDIPYEVLIELMDITGIPETDEIVEILEEHLFFYLIGNREHQSIVYAENGNINFQLRILGGQEVSNRVTIFINHKPVLINGSDFIELTMEQGKMANIQIEIDIDTLEDFNSIYAIVMTTGDDYHIQDIFKTRTLLLINE